MSPTAGGMFVVKMLGHIPRSRVGVRHPIERTVDAGTAIVALFLHGVVVVDVPCRTCAKRGGRWEWWQCASVDDPLHPPERNAWAFRNHYRTTAEGASFRTAFRPCPVCTVHWTPTGREVVDGARLVLDAAAACDHCGGSGREVDAVFHAQTLPADGDPTGPCSVCKGDPGDPKARDTLDTLDVEATRLERSGDARGVVLAAWLAGECLSCEGAGTLRSSPGRGPRACPACHGHGTILGAHADLVERLAAEVIRRAASRPGRAVAIAPVESLPERILRARERGDARVILTPDEAHRWMSFTHVTFDPPSEPTLSIGEVDAVDLMRPHEQWPIRWLRDGTAYAENPNVTRP